MLAGFPPSLTAFDGPHGRMHYLDEGQGRRAKAVLPRELLDADDWLAELEVRDRLTTVPTLLVHAKKDGFSGSSVRRFARMLPANVVLTLPRAGHFFQEDAPIEVADAIRGRFGPGGRQLGPPLTD
jgi:pimeloyl-ACP methyl ester carboxylesterase